MAKPMKVMYDTEFLEDGHTIDLISIGMVRADGRAFYAVSNEFDTERVWRDNWLMANVMPSIGHDLEFSEEDGWDMTITDDAAMSRVEIRDGILDFVSDIWPEFWAWYGAYDHVALCQLFGRMIDLPSKFPMFTCDIRQIVKELGNPPLPVQPEGLHNALEDARFNWTKYEYLQNLKEINAQEDVLN